VPKRYRKAFAEKDRVHEEALRERDRVHEEALRERDQVHEAIVEKMTEEHQRVVAEQAQQVQELLKEISLATPLAILGVVNRLRFFAHHTKKFDNVLKSKKVTQPKDEIWEWAKVARYRGNYASHAAEFPVEDAIIFEKLWLPRDHPTVTAYSGGILDQIKEGTLAAQAKRPTALRHYLSDLPSRKTLEICYKTTYGVTPNFVLAHKHIPKIIIIIKCHGYYISTAPSQQEAGWEDQKAQFMADFDIFHESVVRNYDQIPQRQSEGGQSPALSAEEYDQLIGEDLYQRIIKNPPTTPKDRLPYKDTTEGVQKNSTGAANRKKPVKR